MKTRTVAVFVSLVLFWAAGALAQQDPRPENPVGVEARSVLKAGGESVVDALVKLGSASPSAAAAVIVEVAKNAPRLLQEVIQGLAVVLDTQSLQKALDLASVALRGYPSLAALLDNTIEVFGCSSIDRCAERLHDVPGNFEDGSGDPVDPPASPA
ncbi:MAG TPA: hypothetical protein DIW43_16150 [Spongiibacteraceae bacterium]|nr:hypothetical protein [Spongiibacteraceae bacterium]HCS28991.1 hypothetical protein [Spongiibacteraceae bacterium]|tara:strand:- start:375 stop:842 length:468 start_codon:yes stop_codon:yes gene_type:complete